ncbi:hypothetical protein Rleg9DRAFT_1700 [Rhizobium leguminosarum bv. trifolii WSM597]|uniref:Uncharacterized protein n=1 Tax=Rhizobium leguminosarum bv. trifolii WSM597 TaxID=754764 RepID=I9X2F7_RHILT|nr:hypothetical protein [Rhizobium leguminosarum]EJB02886.1 hypothetical protein Rleg9DRAFT_1700 [Rhizobium leguminosarum bv. trifolii WSM597]
MITPADAIAQLDRAIDESGETVILRRYTAPAGSPRPKIEASIPAFVRPLEAEELAGDIDSTFSNVIISPTNVGGFLPIVKGDKIVIDGKERNVELPKRYKMKGVLVRMKLMIGG